MYLLQRPLPKNLGGSEGGDCLQLAAAANCEHFLASNAAQKAVSLKWSTGAEGHDQQGGSRCTLIRSTPVTKFYIHTVSV